MAASLLVMVVATASSARPAQTAPTTTTTTTTTPNGIPPPALAGDNPQLGAEYANVLAVEKKLQDQLTQAQADAKAANAKLAALQDQTRQTQIELLSAQDAYGKATQVAALREQARRVAARRADVALGRLRHQAVASYVRGGPVGLLQAVLAAHDGQEAGQALAYGNAALGDTNILVSELRAARDKVSAEARAASAARARAAATRRQIAQATLVLVTARDQQATLVNLVNFSILLVNSSLLQVQTSALITGGQLAGGGAGGGLGALIAGLQGPEPNFQLGAVDISSPIPGAKVTSPFGFRFDPVAHRWQLHAGCDLGATDGTPIHAAADGRVIMAQVIGGYGNAVVLDNGNSLATLYAHQSQMLVTVGQLVKKGDIIGLVGATGMATGPHLHFETRIKGIPVDPTGVVDFNAPVFPGAATH